MGMTVVVTRNVAGRFRGFLASVMCEIAPGVYTAPRMSAGVRERVWGVMERWWTLGNDAMIAMTWPDSKLPGGQEVRILGGRSEVPLNDPEPAMKRELVKHDGIYLVRKALGGTGRARLKLPDPDVPF